MFSSSQSRSSIVVEEDSDRRKAREVNEEVGSRGVEPVEDSMRRLLFQEEPEEG